MISSISWTPCWCCGLTSCAFQIMRKRSNWRTVAARLRNAPAVGRPSRQPTGCPGIVYHHVGRIVEAQGLLELSLHRDDEASRQLLIKRFGYDRKVDNLAGLATLAWLRGSP